MKFLRFRWAGIVIAAILLTISAHPAKADIVTTLVGSPVADLANHGYDYTYDVTLTNNEQLSTANRNVTPQFATLYGLAASQAKIVNVTGLLATDFSFTWSPTGSSTYSATPAASPLYNLRYTFTASNTTLSSGLSSIDLGQFTVVSPYVNTTYQSYDGSALKTNGPASGMLVRNIGLTLVPLSPLAPVPEPASMALMTIGFFALAWVGYRRITTKA